VLCLAGGRGAFWCHLSDASEGDWSKETKIITTKFGCFILKSDQFVIRVIPWLTHTQISSAGHPVFFLRPMSSQTRFSPKLVVFRTGRSFWEHD